jgi:beta-lactam-binding protein with PASTA domain
MSGGAEVEWMVRWGLKLVAMGALAASSCALVAKSVQESVHYERSGDFPMPDVAGKTADEARVALALAGITGPIEVVDNYVCDDPGVPETRVCSTAPAAGQTIRASLPVTLRLRPKEVARFVMPDLVGKTGDEARRLLLAAGQQPRHILVETLPGDPGDGCLENRVCRQSPAKGEETVVTGPKLVQLGPQGAGRSARPEPARRDEPEPPGPETPKQAEKPKDKPPEAVF